MNKKIKGLLGAGALVVAGITAAGCSSQLNDLGGIPQASPDYALTYLNVDQFPNITMLCIRGQGFATTTRAGVDILRVPEWDSFCETKIPANGQPKAAPSSTATP